VKNCPVSKELGGIIDRGSKRKNVNEENPLDKYESAAQVRPLAGASYKPPKSGKLKDLKEQMVNSIS
jgi:hypothetical protein